MTDEKRLNDYNQRAQAIRDAINAQPLTAFYPLTKSKGNFYVCPVCGSGTGPNHTGALSIMKDCNRVRCFANDKCFTAKGEDTLGALRKILGKSEREVFEYCGYSLSDSAQVTKSSAPRTRNEPVKDKPEPAHSFLAEIEQYSRALPGSEGEHYLTGRGFTPETMRRFKLGYDAQRHCITIPYNPGGSYYGRRSTNPQTNRPHDNLKGVSMPLFNEGALYSGAKVCFVVESPLCAISIMQEGGAAVALSGTSGQSRLLDCLKRKPTGSILAVCLDNDNAGREATETLGKVLDKMGVPCADCAAAIMGDECDRDGDEYRKDPNEVLQRSGAAVLRKRIAYATADTLRQAEMLGQDAEQEREQRTGAGMVDAFLQDIQSRKYEPIPTGIKGIDEAIGGGFIRQQLIILGAAPGAGKTALAQWIFEGMATRGNPCVYLNLEMSREQILARSFSRISARNGYGIRPTAILQGYNWTDAQRVAVLEAANEYKNTIAPRMIYNPDEIKTANLTDILSYIEQEAQRAEKAGMPAPNVVLDYLQIVNGDPREDAASTIKKAVGALKSYAMRHNAIVFVIIAHNRASNSSGAISMESGRDTSAIEYSADLQLGLTFTHCLKREGQVKKDACDLTPEERREVTLKIVKGRFGGAGREVDLLFNGEVMTYAEKEAGLKPVNEPNPFAEDAPAAHNDF